MIVTVTVKVICALVNYEYIGVFFYIVSNRI
jgi:hypothetical protein